MKFMLLILLVITAFFAKAQFPAPGSHRLDPDIDKFVGTWQWTSGNDTIKIVLQKQTVYYTFNLNFYDDVIVGWHRYVKNGIVVESDLQNVGILWTELNEMVASSLFGTTDGPNKIYFTTFKDYVDNKYAELRFSMLPNSTTQAKWELRNTRGIKKAGFHYPFTMPKDLIFTKQ